MSSFFFLSIVSLRSLLFSECRSHLAPAHPPMPCPHPSSTPPPTACCVNLPLPSSGFINASHCAHLSTPLCKLFFVSFCFAFAHSFHARMSRPHPTWHHPAPPLVLSGCVNAWASLSTLLALTASMPQPQTHYLYNRLDID